MFLARFWGKIAKTVICDQARVNGKSNYEYPGQRWVLKLILLCHNLHIQYTTALFFTLLLLLMNF